MTALFSMFHLLGCTGGAALEQVRSPGPVRGERPPDQQSSVGLAGLYVAGRFRLPVSVEMPHEVSHFGYGTPDEYRVWNPMADGDVAPLYLAPTAQQALTEAVDSLNAVQDVNPASAFARFSVRWDGARPYLVATEVWGLDGRWTPSSPLLDAELTLDLDTTCDAAVQQIVRSAARELAVPGLFEAGVHLPISSEAAEARCVLQGRHAARGHLRAVIAQVEAILGEPMRYRLDYVPYAPQATCFLGENAAGECNQGSLAVTPLHEAETLYVNAQRRFAREGRWEYAVGFAVPRDPKRPGPPNRDFPDVGPPPRPAPAPEDP